MPTKDFELCHGFSRNLVRQIFFVKKKFVEKIEEKSVSNLILEHSQIAFYDWLPVP